MGYAFAVVVVAVLVAWLIFPARRSGRKSVHGFTTGTIGLDELECRRRDAENETKKKMLDLFIAENDAAIRSVLEEYKAIHCPREEVQFKPNAYWGSRSHDISWLLADNEVSFTQPHTTCAIGIKWGWGQPRWWGSVDTFFYPVEIWVNEGIAEPKQLDKALKKILRQSKLRFGKR